MTTPNNLNTPSNVNIGQIVQDLQTYQNDLAQYCTSSAQQLQEALEQLQSIAQTIVAGIPVLQQAYQGLVALGNSADSQTIGAPPASDPNSSQGNMNQDQGTLATVVNAVNNTANALSSSDAATSSTVAAPTNNDADASPSSPAPMTGSVTSGVTPSASDTSDTSSAIQSVSAAVAAVSAQLASSPAARANLNNWGSE